MDVEKMTDDLMTVPFNPQDASEASWSAWFAVSESVFREFNPKSRLPDRGVAKRRLSVASPLYRT